MGSPPTELFREYRKPCPKNARWMKVPIASCNSKMKEFGPRHETKPIHSSESLTIWRYSLLQFTTTILAFLHSLVQRCAAYLAQPCAALWCVPQSESHDLSERGDWLLIQSCFMGFLSLFWKILGKYIWFRQPRLHSVSSQYINHLSLMLSPCTECEVN